MSEGLPEAFFGGPRAPQEAPRGPPRAAKRGPRAAKTAPRAPQEPPREPQEPPRRPQEVPRATKRPSRSLQVPFWLDFRASGAHFRRFWLFEATGNQLAPPRDHRLYRKAAGITAGPPPVSENSLRHRQATACIEKQLAPPPSHRQASDNSSNKFSDNCFLLLPL